MINSDALKRQTNLQGIQPLSQLGSRLDPKTAATKSPEADKLSTENYVTLLDKIEQQKQELY